MQIQLRLAVCNAEPTKRLASVAMEPLKTFVYFA